MPGAGYRFTKETVAETRRNERNPNRKGTFTPWPGSGRASNFAGDSAAAERSAGQHTHSHRAVRFVNVRFPLKLIGSCVRATVLLSLLSKTQARRALDGYISSQDSEKDSTC